MPESRIEGSARGERVEETNRFGVGRKAGKKREKKTKTKKQTVCGEGG